jgi:putative transposase
LISPQLIRARALRLGVVKRRRKVDVVALVYTLILGFTGGQRRTLAGLRRAYALATGTTVASSAFQGRFTGELAELMKQLAERALARLGRGGSRPQMALEAFRRVFIADGSLIRLGDALEQDYPSVWTNHTKASAKPHLVIDAMTRTPTITRIVPGCMHDLPLMTLPSRCRGALLVFDLALYQGKLFQRIIDAGGAFLCRVKRDANFVILDAPDARLVGCKTKDVARRRRGRDWQCTVDYVHRDVRARNWVAQHIRLRLIAIWDSNQERHRQYLTSVSETKLAARDATAIYAMRWEIELLFRELKTPLRAKQMPSANKAAVEALLYASLLALAVARSLHRAVAAQPRGILEPFPIERWTVVIRHAAPALLQLLLAPPRQRWSLGCRILALLRREGADPNFGRIHLKVRAQLGILAH